MVLIGEATLAEEIVEQELLTAVQAILMEDGSLFGEMFEPVTLLVVHVMLLIGDATGSWEMVEQDMSLTPHGAWSMEKATLLEELPLAEHVVCGETGCETFSPGMACGR